ncbi:endogenous retrovirus group K member 113 Gag polyprotein-like [Corvus kubaryi]|uniref:endogenous retrovirus group K member 113 Gag polyprotein-like n=1 Tax=Corvus kubaryi TaxID=68294 RepID=UPI001C04CB67|nr:endogenous retrovirus group K member 113 Gag polyprotein-like [Corvus kubaryi]
MPEPPCHAGRAEPAPPAPPAEDAAPNQEAARPAANPEVVLPRENPEAAAAAERQLGRAAPNAAGDHERGAVTSAALSMAAEQGPSMAPSAAVAPETAAAVPGPARSGLPETAPCKEAAVQTAAQPAAVCAVCSASSELSQSAPLRPFLFTPSTSELPLPDDSSSDSEADEVLAPGRQAAVAVQRRKRLHRSHPWTFQDCMVTVRPTHYSRFLESVKMRALEEGDWRLLETLGMPNRFEDSGGNRGAVTLHPQAVPEVQDGSGSPKGEIQAFPVYKALPDSGEHDKHEVIAWKVAKDLQSKVAQYGLGSAEVMQIIRVINTDLLSPFDIRHLGQILFQPVQFTVFEKTWRKLANKAALANMQLPAADPRRTAGMDALMGTGPFSDPSLQGTLSSSILQQAQQVGMAALLKTIELSALRKRYTEIVQGKSESFLSFVEKVAASLEKQVEDDRLRQMLLRQLLRDNANEECRKITDVLPGDPEVTDMVKACAKVGSGNQKRSALAPFLQPVHTSSGREPKQPKQAKKRKQPKPNQKENTPIPQCKRCGRPGHCLDYCKSMTHADGRPLSGNFRRGARRGNCSLMQSLPQRVAQIQAQAYPATLETAPGDQMVLTSTPQPQLS